MISYLDYAIFGKFSLKTSESISLKYLGKFAILPVNHTLPCNNPKADMGRFLSSKASFLKFVSLK